MMGLDEAFDAIAWRLARHAVDVVRYQPRQLDLALACGVWQPETAPAARWLAEARNYPGVVQALGLPHAALRAVAGVAARWFGPTASVLVRWSGGAVAATSDQSIALALQRRFRSRVHPGMLVPHLHAVAVLAADMRGFSHLTRELEDTQYLADLVGEYLSELTRIVEAHRGVVFQYTGDGLLALFLPELAAASPAEMLARLTGVSTELHRAFGTMHARWRADWRASGHTDLRVGLGLGLCFGSATIGFLGPAGKKQFGVIGEPVNLAAYLCSQAAAGTMLVDQGSFVRAGAAAPDGERIRLRAKKRHHRIDALRILPRAS